MIERRNKGIMFAASSLAIATLLGSVAVGPAMAAEPATGTPTASQTAGKTFTTAEAAYVKNAIGKIIGNDFNTNATDYYGVKADVLDKLAAFKADKKPAATVDTTNTGWLVNGKTVKDKPKTGADTYRITFKGTTSGASVSYTATTQAKPATDKPATTDPAKPFDVDLTNGSVALWGAKTGDYTNTTYKTVKTVQPGDYTITLKSKTGKPVNTIVSTYAAGAFTADQKHVLTLKDANAKPTTTTLQSKDGTLKDAVTTLTVTVKEGTLIALTGGENNGIATITPGKTTPTTPDTDKPTVKPVSIDLSKDTTTSHGVYVNAAGATPKKDSAKTPLATAWTPLAPGEYTVTYKKAATANKGQSTADTLGFSRYTGSTYDAKTGIIELGKTDAKTWNVKDPSNTSATDPASLDLTLAEGDALILPRSTSYTFGTITFTPKNAGQTDLKGDVDKDGKYTVKDLAGVKATANGKPVTGFDPAKTGPFHVDSLDKIAFTGLPEGWTVAVKDGKATVNDPTGNTVATWTFTTAAVTLKGDVNGDGKYSSADLKNLHVLADGKPVNGFDPSKTLGYTMPTGAKLTITGLPDGWKSSIRTIDDADYVTVTSPDGKYAATYRFDHKTSGAATNGKQSTPTTGADGNGQPDSLAQTGVAAGAGIGAILLAMLGGIGLRLNRKRS